jgi:hypothetical protein
MMAADDPPRTWSEQNVRIVAGTILTVVGIVGYVVMALFVHDPDASNIRGAFLFLIAPAAGVFAAGGVATALSQLGAKADKIDTKATTVVRQTNGHLTQHVETVAKKAALEALEEFEARKSTPAPMRHTRSRKVSDPNG